jgi:predicted TIM-barrel fold metal-dependent hydrolase
MQFVEGDLFRDFPTLKFIIPHGGGAVPYHWGRYRGLADMLKRPSLDEHVMKMYSLTPASTINQVSTYLSTLSI